MLKAVGGNVGGELAGFEPARAAELIAAGAAKLVVEFDPETHAFDPKTEQLTEIHVQAPAHWSPEFIDTKTPSLESENATLRGRVDELERDLAAAVELHASAVIEGEKLKADLGAAESLLSAPTSAATPVEETPKS